MYKKQLLSIFGIALALMVIGCEKIDEPVLWEGEAINFRPVAEGIPLEHGRFVAATANNRFEVTLWFEQPDKTVVGVRVHTSRGTVSEAAIIIPRK